MRTFITALAGFWLFATAVQAADDTSPVAGSLPETGSQKVYLFMLKKNGLSLRMGPQTFCGSLGYGVAVTRSDDPDKGFWEQGNVEIKDGKQIPGELAWVICQYPAPPKKDKP
jgi:hypothetical protein